MFGYNVIISLVNVVCFLGFAYCLFYRADSIYSKEFDPVLSDVYHILGYKGSCNRKLTHSNQCIRFFKISYC